MCIYVNLFPDLYACGNSPCLKVKNGVAGEVGVTEQLEGNKINYADESNW